MKTTATTSSPHPKPLLGKPDPWLGLVRRRAGRAIFGLVLAFGLLVGPVAGAASAQSVGEITDEIEQNGSYVERSASGLDAAISNANREGIAFVWLDRNGSDSEATALAADLTDEFRSRNSNYDTALVLFEQAYGASSNSLGQSELDPGLDAALNGFAGGDEADGLAAFTSSVQSAAATTATTIGTSTTGGTPQGSSGGGFGFGPLLLLGAVGAGAFWLFRRWRASKKASEQVELDMEQDRAEIKEQLRDNADMIMSLGDRVIAKGDHEMIAKYEKASETYQEVSQSIDSASTPAEVDALDDRIDNAEWQLESIEAQLAGRPIPPKPVAEDVPPPPTASDRSRANRGQQDDVVVSPRSGRSYPRTRSGSRGRRRSGGMGGGLGGILGSILVGAISNGGLGGASRRTRRRRGSGGFGGLGGGGLGGSIGTSRSGGGLGRGGVLRRGGSRSRSSGGRSMGGRSKSSGGRRF